MTIKTPKLLGNHRIRLKVATAGLAVLVIGSWTAPTGRQLQTSEERVAPLLEEVVERREADRRENDWRAKIDTFTSWGLELRPLVSPATIRDHEAPPAPRRYALPISTKYLVTHQRALSGDGHYVVDGSGDGSKALTVAASHPGSGLVLLESPVEMPRSAELVTADTAAGDTLVAVGGSGGARTFLPVIVTAASPDEYRVSPGDGSIDVGMPLYREDGTVVALYAGFGTARPLHSAIGELTRDAAAGVVRASIGVSLQRINESLSQTLGANGLGILIAQVMPGGPAAAAGVLEGDVLLTLGDAPIAPESAALQVQQLRVHAPVQVTAIRNRRSITMVVTPRPWGEIGTYPGATSQPRAIELFNAQQLDIASVSEDARVVSIDRRAVASTSEARRLLSTRRVSLVQFEMGHDRFFAALGGGQ